MGENSAIEWTHHTFNPWEGCQRVGPGCDNCYAEARDVRFTGGYHWGPGAPRRRTSAANWRNPLRWNREAAASGARPRVFCASLADVFDNAVDPAWRHDLWALIGATPNLDWMLLTKRPGNIAKMLPGDWGAGYPNVWLGCTVVDQDEADRDIPKLLSVPARVRFLSMEPLLGPVDLTRVGTIDSVRSAFPELVKRLDRHMRPHIISGAQIEALGSQFQATTYYQTPDHMGGFEVGSRYYPRLDLVIVGGESGHHARPMHPDWARSLRDQCVAAGVALFFKQWGEWAPSSPEEAAGNPHSGWRCLAGHPHVARAAELYEEAGAAFMARVGKKAAGRLLDGRTWDQMPGVQHG